MKLNSETQLVEAAQNGHLESFGALYERYHSPMVALAYSMLGDRDMAEDAAQEVFVVACRDIGSLTSKERLYKKTLGYADVVKLVYTHGLGPCAARRVGSTPTIGTNK